eukprot:gene2484-2825_t
MIEMIFKYEDIYSAEWMVSNAPGLLRYKIGREEHVEWTYKAVYGFCGQVDDLALFKLVYAGTVIHFTEGATELVDKCCSVGNIDIVAYLLARGHKCSLRGLVYAAVRGHLPLLERLYKVTPKDIWTNAIMDEAASHGHIDIVRFLFARNPIYPVTNHAVNMAAFYNHDQVVRLLYEQAGDRPIWTPTALNNAAASGNLGLVTFLHEQRTEGCTQSALNYASSNGHGQIVEFLLANRSEGCTEYAVDYASKHGHLGIVKLLTEKGAPATTDAMDYASAGGHLEVVRYLHSVRTEGVTVEAINLGARGGHLAVIEFLLATYPSLTSTPVAIQKAAKRGHLAVLDLLTSNTSRGAPATAHALAVGAKKGHLSIVQFLNKSRNVPCSSAAAVAASRRGHVGVVQYILENLSAGDQRPVSFNSLFEAAIELDQIEVLQYLYASHINHLERPIDAYYLELACQKGNSDTIEFVYLNIPMSRFTSLCANNAASNGQIHLLRFFHEAQASRQGSKAIPDYIGVKMTAINGQRRCLEYMMSTIGITLNPSDDFQLSQVCQGGHLTCVRYLYEQHGMAITEDCIRTARFYNHSELLAYLLAQKKPTKKTIGNKIKGIFKFK